MNQRLVKQLALVVASTMLASAANPPTSSPHPEADCTGSVRKLYSGVFEWTCTNSCSVGDCPVGPVQHGTGCSCGSIGTINCCDVYLDEANVPGASGHCSGECPTGDVCTLIRKINKNNGSSTYTGQCLNDPPQ